MDEKKSQSRMTPTDEDRRLIEELIPLNEISIESAKEKQGIRPGQISALHIWWARRPLTYSKAVVFASLIKKGKVKADINNFLIEMSKWDNLTKQSIIQKARQAIFNSIGYKPKILDCFAGGGAIPLKALSLGCKTYALDLNPVANLIELCTLYYPQKFNTAASTELRKSEDLYRTNLANDVYRWGIIILNQCKKEIGDLFPEDNDESIPTAYLWARTITCSNPSCNLNVPLLRQYWLVNKSEKKIALQPIVNQESKEITFKITKKFHKDFNPSIGTVRKGSVNCPFCNQVSDVKYIRESANKGTINQKLIAVVLRKKEGGNKYREVEDIDIQNEKKVKDLITKFQKERIGNIPLIPDEKLPPVGTLGFRIQRYGFKKWIQMFTDRQIVTHITFLKQIRKAHEEIKKGKDVEYTKAICTYLALCLDRNLDYNSSFCTWLPTLEVPGHLFSRQAIPMVWDYCESNPFNGRVKDWLSGLKRTCEIIDFCADCSNEPAEIKQGSATSLPYNNKLFDAVIIDPPYYDAVPYSDLSDFFYIWLKRSVGDMYPELFGTLLTPKSKEIVQHPQRQGGIEESKVFFENEMTKVFEEINRTLKDNGICVVIFAHKSTDAWETLINSLLKAELYVTASWPFHTETQTRLRAQNSAALASSITIVCRKIKSLEEGYFNEVKEELKQIISRKLDQFWMQGIKGADFFISAIGPAVEVFGKYKKVMKLTGEEVSVAELLDLVREIVTDYSLQKILKGKHMGKVDDETRFYLLWRWAYDDNDVPYDDARKLAQALGTEADELLNKKDLLEKKGDKVNLNEPWERKKNVHLGEPRGGMPAPMIDVIHKSCLMWESGDKQELTDFIESSGYANDDTIWNVAQAISDVLPDGNKEKQLIQGLLASKQSISKDLDKKGFQGKLQEFMK